MSGKNVKVWPEVHRILRDAAEALNVSQIELASTIIIEALRDEKFLAWVLSRLGNEDPVNNAAIIAAGVRSFLKQGQGGR